MVDYYVYSLEDDLEDEFASYCFVVVVAALSAAFDAACCHYLDDHSF